MQGVSTRQVEALVQALGIVGISKSAVSRRAAALDEQVEAFRTRRLDAAYPYLWGMPAMSRYGKAGASSRWR